MVLYSDEEKLSEKEVKHQRKKSKTSTKSSACKTKKSSLPPKHTNSKKKLKPEVSKKTLKKKSEIFVKDTEMDEVDELEGEEYDESEEELLLKSKLSKGMKTERNYSDFYFLKKRSSQTPMTRKNLMMRRMMTIREKKERT